MIFRLLVPLCMHGSKRDREFGRVALMCIGEVGSRSRSWAAVIVCSFRSRQINKHERRKWSPPRPSNNKANNCVTPAAVFMLIVRPHRLPIHPSCHQLHGFLLRINPLATKMQTVTVTSTSDPQGDTTNIGSGCREKGA